MPVIPLRSTTGRPAVLDNIQTRRAMVVFRDPVTLRPFLLGQVDSVSHRRGNTLALGSGRPVVGPSGSDASQAGPSACRMSFGPHLPGLIRVKTYTGISCVS